MLTIFIYDKHELKIGIKKEMTEHGMSKEEATKTAKDHLKENPHYYSVADSVGLEDEELAEAKYKSGFGKGKMGNSKHAQGIPSGKKFPFTQKSGRLWKIKSAAKKGPVVAVGAGFGGPAESLEKD